MRKVKTGIKILHFVFWIALLGALLLWGHRVVTDYLQEKEVLERIITRLSADSRVAEVLVTALNYDEKSHKTFTTIKFLEYDVNQNPLPPRYFTFSGNIIQFQALVIRFDDMHIRNADAFKGKSAYIFWKVFMLDGENTQEYEITKVNEIPSGYKLPGEEIPFERDLWKDFWHWALDTKKARAYGIKNAQIEAPGTMFVPGKLYTIKIEHDGGLRIDADPLPSILQGETIP